MVIAIDGPSGVGKTTVARQVARSLGVPHLDTGATYRAAAVAVLRAGIDAADHEAIVDLVGEIDLGYDESAVTLDGVDVTDELRTAETTATASAISAIPGVRAVLVEVQRAWVDAHGDEAVVEGRDIGTVVFPHALAKVFLTARPSVRAARRAAEEEQEGRDAGRIEADLQARDHADSTRAAAPLQPADDAVVIDTSDLDFDQVVARVLAIVAAARARSLRR